jgi:hypothetical protein
METENNFDNMIEQEMEYQRNEARKTPQQKMQEQFDIINRCWENINVIFEKLEKV